MYINKENYEAKIKASPLFSLNRETVAFKREALKMVEYLYCYLMCINENKYIDFGVEITETAQACIKNFKNDGGDFLNYFNAAWAKEYRRAYAKQNSDSVRGGIHVSEDYDRTVRKIIRYAKQKGITEYSKEFVSQLSEILDISEDKINECIQMIHSTSVISEYTTNDDGEEISLFDTIADVNEKNDTDGNITMVLLQIEVAFNKLQERQKPIISALMTAKVCESIFNNDIATENYSFINDAILKEYIRFGTIPTQRDIANQFGKNEASISRALKDFLEKIKNQ